MAPPSLRALLHALVLVGVLVLVSEIISFAAGKLLVRSAILYDPPRAENYAGYLADRDPVVGWPLRTIIGRGEFDSRGSRVVPVSPDPAAPSCVALFGGSFTWGSEVPPEHAYGNVLAGLMRCRVANYGVPGYGTDQAYLRYARTISDNAPIVILGHYSENIIRNINQERGFLTNQILWLKPRFVLEADELKLIPLPSLTEAEFHSLRSRAPQLLPFDYFAPGGPSGIHSFGFPYTLSALGAIRHYRVQAMLRRQPSYAQFYDPEHPSRALQITDALIRTFAREARTRNQKPMVLLIPDAKDLHSLRNHGVIFYGELVSRLKSADIIVLDVAEQLNKEFEDRDLCKLFVRCDGHFTSEGYRRLAEIVFTKLREIGWV